jgi:hypothetical protein
VIPPLGIIEGYFGRAWSWPDRAYVVDQLAPAGYSFFHYAPKADAKLRRRWREPFTEAELAEIAAFAAHCRLRGMRFGVGLTPFEAHEGFDSQARADLRAKLDQLRSLLPDDLVVMFDDMRGDVPDLAMRQGEIVYECLASTVASRCFVVPSYYSDDPILDQVFGERPQHYLRDLGQAVHRSAFIYWTGEEVCSREIRAGHLDRVADLLGRKVALWDNYPVNDGPRKADRLHLRAFTGRSSTLAGSLSHHAVNPLSQPRLGCIPALTLPEVYRLGEAYSYGAAFRSASAKVAGEELAGLLSADLLRLEDAGRSNLDAAAVDRLLERYGAVDHPAAAEVVDWLSGGYAVTGETVMTQ